MLFISTGKGKNTADGKVAMYTRWSWLRVVAQTWVVLSCLGEYVRVCMCVCVFYDTFTHGVQAQSKTYTFISELCLA